MKTLAERLKAAEQNKADLNDCKTDNFHQRVLWSIKHSAQTNNREKESTSPLTISASPSI